MTEAAILTCEATVKAKDFATYPGYLAEAWGGRGCAYIMQRIGWDDSPKGAPKVVWSSGSLGDGFAVGQIVSAYADQSGRSLGYHKIIGIWDAERDQADGDVPDKRLPLYCFK